MRRTLLRLLAFFRSGHAEADLAREINAHLRLLEEQFVAQGMSARDARYAARRAFGGVAQVQERQRDARSFGSIDAWWLDVKLGIRIALKYPILTLVAGTAISVTTAICATSFAFLYASLHPTLPLAEGERVVGLENWDTVWNNQEDRILHDFVTWRGELDTIQQLSAAQLFRRNVVDAAGQAWPVHLAEMSASGFELARMPPLLGRYLVASDEWPDAPAVAVIGYDLWRSRFGADPGVLGRRVRIGSGTCTVVGVMPAGFAFPVSQDVWVPFRARPEHYDRRRGPNLVVFGRLAPGVTREQAQAQLSAIGQRSALAFPETHTRLRPRIVRFTEMWFDDEPRSGMHTVQLAVTMLLLVVGVNVAILIYARTATRQNEIVIRTTLGASRRRVAAQLFVEALVLSATAAAVGLALAGVALAQANAVAGMVGRDFGGLPFWMTFSLSPGTVIYTAGLAVLTAVVAGVGPALKATGRSLQGRLGQLAPGAGPRLGRTWTALVVAQVAVVVAILPAAAWLALQSIRLAAADPGFPVGEYVSTRILMDESPPPSAVADQYWTDFYARYRLRLVELMRRVEADTAVADLTITSREPGVESPARFEIDRHPPGSWPATTARQGRVGIDFFETFDVPLLGGRLFSRADEGAPIRPVIVNRSFAHNVLRDPNPIGRRVRFPATDVGAGDPNPWREIVGVVADFPPQPLSPEATTAALYQLLLPGQDHGTQLVIRVRGGAVDAFMPRLRAIAAAIDPALQVTRLKPLADVYRQEQAGMRYGAIAVTLVAVSILLLSAAGIYALMSVTVTRRTKEIGIRVALGADRAQILRGVFRQALLQVGAGVAIGLGVAAAVDAAAGGALGPEAAVILAVTSLVMLAVASLAALGPARRALRIAPTEALRADV